MFPKWSSNKFVHADIKDIRMELYIMWTKVSASAYKCIQFREELFPVRAMLWVKWILNNICTFPTSFRFWINHRHIFATELSIMWAEALPLLTWCEVLCSCGKTHFIIKFIIHICYTVLEIYIFFLFNLLKIRVPRW